MLQTFLIESTKLVLRLGNIAHLQYEYNKFQMVVNKISNNIIIMVNLFM